MCGITGLFQPNDAQASRATVAQMTDALVHRGPDASGVWADGGVALGHRRLSILDLSEAGAQPMHSACGCRPGLARPLRRCPIFMANLSRIPRRSRRILFAVLPESM